PSGPALAHGLLSGIEAVGGHGVDVGELPTPALYFATHVLNVDGGVQVTGSHNPPEFNGFKLVLGGEAIAGADIQGLRRLIEEGRTPGRPGGGRSEDGSVLPRYRDAIVQRNGPLPRKVKAVVDCGNGVSSLVAVDTLRRLGASVVPLFCESDGTFPNHHPDPTVIENLRDLQAAVRREGAELGIAFDGDGDRIGAVDEQGRAVFGDLLLVLLGRDLARRSGPGHAVIFDVKCSEVLPQELKRVGLEPVMWKTGHSLIKQRMKELHAPLAGEMSGHMFFAGDWYGFDDALFAAARLLRYLAERGGRLSPATGPKSRAGSRPRGRGAGTGFARDPNAPPVELRRRGGRAGGAARGRSLGRARDRGAGVGGERAGWRSLPRCARRRATGARTDPARGRHVGRGQPVPGVSGDRLRPAAAPPRGPRDRGGGAAARAARRHARDRRAGRRHARARHRRLVALGRARFPSPALRRFRSRATSRPRLLRRPAPLGGSRAGACAVRHPRRHRDGRAALSRHWIAAHPPLAPVREPARPDAPGRVARLSRARAWLGRHARSRRDRGGVARVARLGRAAGASARRGVRRGP